MYHIMEFVHNYYTESLIYRNQIEKDVKFNFERNHIFITFLLVKKKISEVSVVTPLFFISKFFLLCSVLMPIFVKIETF